MSRGYATNSDRRDRRDQPTHGVPEPVEFRYKQGSNGTRVYECASCGERMRSTRKARRHTSCTPAPECPICGSTTGRVDVSTSLGRVDYCPRCHVTFETGVP